MADTKSHNYMQGHHRSVTVNHATRTAEVDGSFLLPYLKPTDHILDVGCGPGTISTGFTKYVPDGSVAGIDLTSEVIDQAHELLQKQDPRPKNITFSFGNVLDGLPYEDGHFDVVFCNQVLLHIPNPVTALQEMRRVCKPGGIVACREGDWPFHWTPYLPGIGLFNRYLYEAIYGSANQARPDHPDHPPHSLGHRSGSLIQSWARKAGFNPDTLVKKASVEVHASAEERSFYCDIFTERIEKGGHRQKFMDCGASKQDVDTMIVDLKRWADDVDGWQGILQCEVICYA